MTLSPKTYPYFISSCFFLGIIINIHVEKRKTNFSTLRKNNESWICFWNTRGRRRWYKNLPLKITCRLEENYRFRIHWITLNSIFIYFIFMSHVGVVNFKIIPRFQSRWRHECRLNMLKIFIIPLNQKYIHLETKIFSILWKNVKLRTRLILK